VAGSRRNPRSCLEAGEGTPKALVYRRKNRRKSASLKTGRYNERLHMRLREVGGGGGLGEVEADYGRRWHAGGGRRRSRVERGCVGRRSRGETPLFGGFQGEVGEELARSGSFEAGRSDRAVGVELYADVDTDGAVNGGAGFFRDYGKNFVGDFECGTGFGR